MTTPTLSWLPPLPGSRVWVSAVVDHGLVDRNGRPLGGYCKIEQTEASSRGPGFRLMVLAARGGRRFGPAWNRGTMHPSLEAAQAAAPAALAAQRARYAKQHGRAAP